MESKKYINEPETVKMSRSEFDSRIAEATEKGYHSGRENAEKEMEEMHKHLQEVEKDKILLQVRNDQLLRATKEIALCLQYETGNGFIK